MTTIQGTVRATQIICPYGHPMTVTQAFNPGYDVAVCKNQTCIILGDEYVIERAIVVLQLKRHFGSNREEQTTVR